MPNPAAQRQRPDLSPLTPHPLTTHRATPHSGSYLDTLPLELILEIFTYTSQHDVAALRRVCSGFNALISAHEPAIAAGLLAANADLRCLAQYFPPPFERGTKTRRRSLAWVNTLAQRQQLCSALAYHLAGRSMESFYGVPPPPLGPTSLFRVAKLPGMVQVAVDIVQRRLMRQLYGVLHFLAFTQLRFQATIAMLAAESGDYMDRPNLDALRATFRDVQRVLIQDLGDKELVSRHHAFTFLVNSIRIALSPEPPHNVNDELVGVLLRCKAPLAACVRFFDADRPNASRKLSKLFMQEMQTEREELRARLDLKKGVEWRPRIGEVWFEIAREELKKRGLQRHRCDGMFVLPGTQKKFVIGCPDCEEVN